MGRKIKKQFQEHKIKIKITGCKIIPRLKRFIYILKPTKGNRKQSILSRVDDIQSTLGLPLFYAYEDGTSIVLVVSEHEVKEMKLLKILRSSLFNNTDMEIPLAVGYELAGDMHIVDLAKLHHLLIVGPTGSGKSVALKCLILSIIVNCPIDIARLVVLEIGSKSLSAFSDVLHLHHPIVKDSTTGILVLESIVAEMESRYELDESECNKLPYIVCIIDEFDDTVSNIGDKHDSERFTAALNTLIRRGRKAKIILVLASHDPTLKTTKINANGIESRISFRLLKHQNSSAALGIVGAEKLPGDGAMILKTPGNVTHLQGSWVTGTEIEQQILCTRPTTDGDIEMLKIVEPEMSHLPTADNEVAIKNAVTEKSKKELADIIMWTLRHEEMSANKIQKQFRMSKRANDILDTLQKMNIVSGLYSNQPRTVVPKLYEDLSPDTVAYLNRYGYTEEDIRTALSIKNGSD